ncbi:hypothetical protein [Jannaschia pohangensis]|uniref:Flagellar assembly protein FliH n=1 Tax=Jannaschia pohangensis TaxID=390807 RepID=A0A1I3R8N6_9RHOB|nr:hypothetical protein [Jannaschia pohangensis]SFJ42122.1 flagellar assembly protein FliH [Jannaschia pohangensis]
MTALALEDFGRGKAPSVPRTESPVETADRFDEGYNAGWDDALAQVEAQQTRVSEQLAERLQMLGREQRAAMATALQTMEPVLRDIFDKLLPHMAERAFLGILMEDLRDLVQRDTESVTIVVAPEEVAALTRLVERADFGSLRVTVEAEAALPMSQALVRWPGQERRIDLEGTLTALDDALETFLETMDRGEAADSHPLDDKEAMNG